MQLVLNQPANLCITSLKDPVTSSGILYTEELLYYHGDLPANAAESGQQMVETTRVVTVGPMLVCLMT